MESMTRSKDANIELAKELGLLPEEYERIQEILGRAPNFTELSIFSGMWSEHCSYKNSIRWLKTLPSEGKNLLSKAGEENAGLVDIGNGLACAFKIESHNHPSAIEPYHGAATGVGGINRDIFTMGARPVAQLNSLRFGHPDLQRTKWHVRGVVKGIGDYGNSFGVPVLGGEVFFDECYNTNPLVNAMSVGLVETDKTISATAHGPGNPVYIVGSATGKDGIHGAAFASRDITEASMDDLPAVQVGDPFQEKLLLEATMELANSDTIVGMQDMGAAGIICSTSEMAAEGECGMRIDLDRVPTRQAGMQPFEILLSESQERMLVVIQKGKESEVERIFEKWDLNCARIGEVTDDGIMQYRMNGEEVARVPAWDLVLGGGAPVYERDFQEPDHYKKSLAFSVEHVPEPADLKEVAFDILRHPNIASKEWVIHQYDTMVGTVNMTTERPADAGVIDIRGTDQGLGMTTDGNPRYIQADPEKGAMIAVAESARNLVCSGAKPLAVTNCLNFGNPYDPEVYWQFVKAIEGMGAACRKFETPVTGGNVSFYNQTMEGEREEAVFPSPVIGMVGSLKDKKQIMTLSLKEKGDLILEVGPACNDINASHYLTKWHGIRHSPAPYFDLEEEYETQQAILDLIEKELINAAHDVSDGGLFTTLAEMGIPRGLGFDIEMPGSVRPDIFLFGESQGRIVITLKEDREEETRRLLDQKGIPFRALGHVTRGKMIAGGHHLGFIDEARSSYKKAFEAKMEDQSEAKDP